MCNRVLIAFGSVRLTSRCIKPTHTPEYSRTIFSVLPRYASRSRDGTSRTRVVHITAQKRSIGSACNRNTKMQRGHVRMLFLARNFEGQLPVRALAENGSDF